MQGAGKLKPHPKLELGLSNANITRRAGLSETCQVYFNDSRSPVQVLNTNSDNLDVEDYPSDIVVKGCCQNMESNALLVGMLIGAAIVVAIVAARDRRPINLAKPVRVPLGRYLAGFAEAASSLDKIECRIDESAYHFASNDRDDFGRIPRAAIVKIFAVEKSALLDKLSSTKRVSFPALGIDPKKPQPLAGYCLIIDWREFSNERHNAIFEYVGPFAKTRAHNDVATLLRFRKPHVAPLLFDQKKCPYCSEVIKKDAVKCKHCHEMLVENRIKTQLSQN